MARRQVLGMHDAHDVLGLALEDRQAGVRALQRLAQDLFGRRVGVDHLDAGTVQHDLLHRALMQVERAQKPVAMFLLHHALGMADGQRAHDLFLHRQHVGAGLDLHAEGAQHAAHDQPHGGDGGGEDRDDDRDGPAARAAERSGSLMA
jgi:hypothetical protein